MRATGRSDTVLFVVYDGVRLLDVTGPLEVFTVANEHGGTYRPVLASPDGRDVVSSAGVRLGADVALSEVTGPVGTLVVPGAPDWQATAADRPLLDQIRRLAAGRQQQRVREAGEAERDDRPGGQAERGQRFPQALGSGHAR
ncbi:MULTISPECIES: DJ-1/PfpI family protein [unclassified Micromonospora]|uniref:DJ-1/PfpI family protein n=1 Tax=unclassified Micromonospora TaxID=2617518 RepID=UPI002FF32545